MAIGPTYGGICMQWWGPPPSVPTTSPEGWVCPKCGSVMAPWMPTCPNCKGRISQETVDTTIYGGAD